MRNDRKLEQIVFPVPSVCQYLTEESKQHVLQKTKCNEQGSKVDDFFKQTQWLFEEMQCQKELRGEGGREGGREGGEGGEGRHSTTLMLLVGVTNVLAI